MIQCLFSKLDWFGYLNGKLIFQLYRFDDTGFNVNGVKYEGSLICVGNLVMSWSPKKFSEVTPERYVLLVLYNFDIFFVCWVQQLLIYPYFDVQQHIG